MQINLTVPQYEAIERVRQSIENRTAISRITIGALDTFAGQAPFVRVEFASGWGNRLFDIDLSGNSEPVNFGDSAISVEHR